MKKASQPGGPKLCFLVIWTKLRKTQRFTERIYLTLEVSIINEINPEYSLEGLMLKLKLQVLWPPDANG